MVSKKIQDLSNDDLDYLEQLLKQEFSKQNDSSKIIRIREALRSQKTINNILKDW